jgi:hypothetical protein
MAGYVRKEGGINVTTGFSNANDGGLKRDRNGAMTGNLYYNANVVAIAPYGTNLPKSSFPAAFSDSRAIELLKNGAQNYHVSLIRCALSTRDLPAFVPNVCPNPNNANDINYLDYRVGAQLRTAGSVFRSIPGTASNESGITMAVGYPTIGSKGFSQPVMTVYSYVSSAAADTPAPIQVTWNLQQSRFQGNISQSGTAGYNWVDQLNTASTIGGTQYLAFGSYRTNLPIGGTGQFIGGSASYLTIANNQASTRVTIDFTVHGSYDPSGWAKILGIPVGSIIQINGSSTPNPSGTYCAPLGILTGPGTFDLSLTAFTNLQWVTEDLTAAIPNAPVATGPPPTTPYYYCYSISNFLANVVNPAIDLAIRGPIIATGSQALDLRLQSLQVQKAVYMNALTSGPVAFAAANTYVPGQVVFYPAPSSSAVGVAYVAQVNVPVTTSSPVYPTSTITVSPTTFTGFSVSSTQVTFTFASAATGYQIGYPVTVSGVPTYPDPVSTASITAFSCTGTQIIFTLSLLSGIYQVGDTVVVTGIPNYTVTTNNIPSIYAANGTYTVSAIGSTYPGETLLICQSTLPASYPTSSGSVSDVRNLNGSYTVALVNSAGNNIVCNLISPTPTTYTSSSGSVVVPSFWAPVGAGTAAIIPDSSSTTNWSSSASYALGAGAIYGGQVWVALGAVSSGGKTPDQSPSWGLAGQPVQSSWVSTQAYNPAQYVTYQGLDYYSNTTVAAGGAVPPLNSAWTISTDFNSYPNTLQRNEADPLVASASPWFSYSAANLFDLHMDTYSINGAEDSLGLSGGAPVRKGNMTPFFESMNLVSDVAFANLFSSFVMTMGPNTYVPYIWGGVSQPLESALTTPPTLAVPPYTSTVTATPQLGLNFPPYADRLARLGITLPLPSSATDFPQFPILNQYPLSFYYTLHQQFESTSTIWCPVDAIVITSADIPLKKELVGNATYVPSTSPASTGTVSGNQTAQILTDFSVAMSNANDYRSFTLYIPTGEYRRISLKETAIFQTISFVLWWRNRLTQQLIPVTLSPGGSCNLKFLFEPIE